MRAHAAVTLLDRHGFECTLGVYRSSCGDTRGQRGGLGCDRVDGAQARGARGTCVVPVLCQNRHVDIGRDGSHVGLCATRRCHRGSHLALLLRCELQHSRHAHILLSRLEERRGTQMVQGHYAVHVAIVLQPKQEGEYRSYVLVRRQACSRCWSQGVAACT